MTVPARTAVVHLVRHANGLDPYETFLSSYRRFEAGADCDLVLLLKGFPAPRDADPYRERAAGLMAGSVLVPDTGYDLRAYVAAARTLPHARVCFLNSYSEILADGWLAQLERALDDPGVGAAGVTGSWGSQLSFSRWQVGLEDPYARAFGDVRHVRRAMDEMRGVPFAGDLAHWLAALMSLVRETPLMTAFPDPHLRTNAFLMDRTEFAGLRWGRLRTKRSSYRMESGRWSLTRQLHAHGRRTVVVDCHGIARDWPEWDAGAVFWQDDQQDLLVADNQTRRYADGKPEWRRILSGLAWGDRARPG